MSPNAPLPIALTIPDVTVEFNPNGFPTAITISPISTSSLLLICATGKFCASILMTAISVRGSRPINFALYSFLSDRITLIPSSFASATT